MNIQHLNNHFFILKKNRIKYEVLFTYMTDEEIKK